MPGPHVRNSAFVASSSAGDSATIAPTFRSFAAHPSRRLPMPGANESSTVEWHSAQVMPTRVSVPERVTVPLDADDRVQAQQLDGDSGIVEIDSARTQRLHQR